MTACWIPQEVVRVLVITFSRGVRHFCACHVQRKSHFDHDFVLHPRAIYVRASLAFYSAQLLSFGHSAPVGCLTPHPPHCTVGLILDTHFAVFRAQGEVAFGPALCGSRDQSNAGFARRCCLRQWPVSAGATPASSGATRRLASRGSTQKSGPSARRRPTQPRRPKGWGNNWAPWGCASLLVSAAQTNIVLAKVSRSRQSVKQKKPRPRRGNQHLKTHLLGGDLQMTLEQAKF